MAKITNRPGPRKGTRRVTITFSPGEYVPGHGGDFNSAGNWRVRKVLEKNSREADEWAQGFEREMLKQWADLQRGIVPKGQIPTFEEYADEYRLHLANNYPNEATRTSYLNELEIRVLPFFGKMRLDEIRRTHVERFKASMQVGTSRQTTALVVLRAVLELARTDELIDKVPPIRIHRSKGPNKVEEDEYWSVDETARIEAALHTEPRIANWVLFAVSTGLRKGELRGLRWCDVDFTPGKLSEFGFVWVRRQITPNGKVKAPKNNSVRRVPLNATSRKALLRQRPETFMQDGAVFTYSNRVVQAFNRLQRTAGVKRITPHGMRHTFATRALLEGYSLPSVQNILGHKNITTTMRYAHVSPELHAADAAKFPDLTDNKLTTTTRGMAKSLTLQRQEQEPT